MEKELALLGGEEWGAETLAGSVYMGPEPVEVASVEETSQTAAEGVGLDPALIAAGKSAFKRCSACHAVGEGAKNKTGPQLNAIVGRTIGGLDSFSKYSGVLKDAAEEGRVWDDESLTAFLAEPKTYFKGTKMSFRGLSDPEEIKAVIEYLRSYSD